MILLGWGHENHPPGVSDTPGAVGECLHRCALNANRLHLVLHAQMIPISIQCCASHRGTLVGDPAFRIVVYLDTFQDM